MSIILIIIGLICCLTGIVGSIIPVLPGLPISWVGILLLYFIPGMTTNYWLLAITLLITIVMFALGYTIPAKGAKKYGGSKSGAIGATIGVFAGLFFPFGILLGPFIGAFVGELIFNGSSSDRAFKAAWGSFIGFLAGVMMNVIVAMVFLGVFIYVTAINANIIF